MDNPDHSIDNDSDSSSYIGADATSQMDFGGLLSRQFTNIVRMYTSPHGVTELYAATRYGKRFVLKALKEEYRNDPIHTLALAKEFEIGIFLEHANIRRTIGLENVEGLGKVIVLEYVDGLPLDKFLASGKISVASARNIASQIVAALGYLHSKQIFHRDLKPANILVSHHGEAVKLIDFNLSDSNDFVVLKNPAGSKKYMAPEQQQTGAVPTVAADVYSLGVVIDELAAAAGDGQLSEIAGKCRQQDPEKRPQAVSQIKLPSSQQTLSDFLASKTLTWIMLVVCSALLAYIAYKTLNP